MELDKRLVSQYYSIQSDATPVLYLKFFNQISSRFELTDLSMPEEKLPEIIDKLKKMDFDSFEEKLSYRISDKCKEEDKRLRINLINLKNDQHKIIIRLWFDYLLIYYSNEDKKGIKYIFDKLLPLFREYHIDIKTKPVLKMLIQTCDGIKVTEFNILEQDLDLDNYNENFDAADKKITSFIENPNKSGLVLLHGKPGTGKTSYIRSLITRYKQKSFIYIPNDMIEVIVRPDFLPVIANNPESVLILEDCERLIMSRDNSTTTATMGVSNILNMTDGLLSDCLKMKIIATFNCGIADIDSALKRPGRLIYDYDFEYLSHDRALNLVKKYKITKTIDKDKQYSLADIYADTDIGKEQTQKRQLGFAIQSTSCSDGCDVTAPPKKGILRRTK